LSEVIPKAVLQFLPTLEVGLLSVQSKNKEITFKTPVTWEVIKIIKFPVHVKVTQLKLFHSYGHL
jgi:hypothetical protein